MRKIYDKLIVVLIDIAAFGLIAFLATLPFLAIGVLFKLVGGML